MCEWAGRLHGDWLPFPVSLCFQLNSNPVCRLIRDTLTHTPTPTPTDRCTHKHTHWQERQTDTQVDRHTPCVTSQLPCQSVWVCVSVCVWMRGRGREGERAYNDVVGNQKLLLIIQGSILMNEDNNDNSRPGDQRQTVQ